MSPPSRTGRVLRYPIKGNPRINTISVMGKTVLAGGEFSGRKHIWKLS